MKTNHFKLADSSFSLSILCKKNFFFHNINSFFLNLNLRPFVYHLALTKKTLQNRGISCRAFSKFVPKTTFRDNNEDSRDLPVS